MNYYQYQALLKKCRYKHAIYKYRIVVIYNDISFEFCLQDTDRLAVKIQAYKYINQLFITGKKIMFIKQLYKL